MSSTSPPLGKPIRTAVWWQFIATSALTVIAALAGGWHAAVSSFLGGGVSISAVLVFAAVASLHKGSSAAGTLIAALRAEAAKIVTIVGLLWLVLATYRDVVAPVFVGAFAVSVLISGMAFFVRDNDT